MESVYDQTTQAINWDEWSRVVDAAQDPKYRDSVAKFLSQADLSAEIPPALDAQVLAPRRSAGATGEQCAYILCNLGFAALAVAASKGSAEFAMACSGLVEQLEPDSQDLAFRRHFLSSKAALVVAALTDQPHLYWDNVAERCTAYFRAINDNQETLPTESVESNATAAYSFTGQFLSRLLKLRAVKYYADEVSQLIETALGLASRLPSSFVSRMRTTLMPGTDVGVLFRQVGAMAEWSLQVDEHSLDHAKRGLTYIDEILSQSAVQSAPDLEIYLQIRAELLLLSGRHAEASEQAETLESSSDPSVREGANAIKARCHLKTGNPELAAELLAQVAPTTDQTLERWRATWMGDAAEGYWTTQPDKFSPLQDHQLIWRLQAVAAADLENMPEFLEVANRSTGFLVDSLFQDRQEWVDRMRAAIGNNPSGSNGVRVLPTERPITKTTVADVDPMVALDEILAQLADGTALLQVINTEQGILTWVARQRGGDVSLFVAPDRPNVKKLTEVHKEWSRACFNSLRHDAGSPEASAKCEALFSGLMDEVRRNWGDLLQGLVEDGITQLILIGDDLVDIPLHAVLIGPGNERLIDRVPVTCVPSLSALRACIGRTPINKSERGGVALRSLIGSNSDSADADAVATTLGTPLHKLAPDDASFWSEVAAAQVLHVVAHATHNARAPFDTLIGAGWLDLNVAEIIAGLDLPQCEIVSNLLCESAVPATLRAPGLDFAAIFLAAGARSVLASTWVVRDELASELTQLFWTGSRGGISASAATTTGAATDAARRLLGRYAPRWRAVDLRKRGRTSVNG
jgi:hypothetical protein